MDTPQATTGKVPTRREAGRLERWWNSKTMKRFRRNPLAITGALIIIGFAFIALFAPLLTEPGRTCIRDLGLSAGTVDNIKNPLKPAFWKMMIFPPNSCNFMPRSTFSPIPETAAESGTLLGTTSRGYDIYYGLIWGTRTAFRIGVLVVGISLIIGIIIGSVSAYFGGWVDTVLMRFTDIVLSIPALVLALVVIIVLGNSVTNVMLAIAVVAWPGYARVLRGDILQVKEQEYVDGARAMGARGPRIIFKHILPNAIAPLIIIASLDIGAIVLTAATLSFLGVGTPVGYADWGQMISFARNWIIGPPGEPFGYWFVSFWPGITIVLFIMGWNLLGDAFRDVLDPRSN